MKHFSDLYARLDETTKTNEKVAALRDYFQAVDPADAAWAIYFLSGRKLRQIIPTRRMCEWAAEAAKIPAWLFDESYEMVGDLAETMALVLPPPERATTLTLAEWVERRLIPLRGADEADQRERLGEYWRELDPRQRFLLHKIVTGGFRVGVSQRLVLRGLANAVDLPLELLAHRMMGDWEPSAEWFQTIVHPDDNTTVQSQPYPFFLAHPLEHDPEQLGPIDDWQVEWKWDGIRAQMIRRADETFLWSRGEELITDRFPELLPAAADLPDGTVIDGEILAYRDGILPFMDLQRRIGRKQLGPKILRDVPVVFVAFDLLEFGGIDIRTQQLSARRQQLVELLGLSATMWSQVPSGDRMSDDHDKPSCSTRLWISPEVTASTWQEIAAKRQDSRANRAEGLMLKRRSSAYRVGRPRGEWWKWKIEAYTIDAVLVYAQRGSGRRAGLYTDYTFAVWQHEELVPIAKAYSGLTDAEIREVDAFVRQHTVDRFGPVRQVEPRLVFEIAFENIQLSNRHKSGIAVRFPRIARWRHDLAIHQADHLETIKRMLSAETP